MIELPADLAAREVTRSCIGGRDAVVRVRIDIREPRPHRVEQRHVLADRTRRADDTGWREGAGRKHAVMAPRTVGSGGTGGSDHGREPHANRYVGAGAATVDVRHDYVVDVRRDQPEIDAVAVGAHAEDRLALRP